MIGYYFGSKTAKNILVDTYYGLGKGIEHLSNRSLNNYLCTGLEDNLRKNDPEINRLCGELVNKWGSLQNIVGYAVRNLENPEIGLAFIMGQTYINSTKYTPLPKPEKEKKPGLISRLFKKKPVEKQEIIPSSVTTEEISKMQLKKNEYDDFYGN